MFSAFCFDGHKAKQKIASLKCESQLCFAANLCMTIWPLFWHDQGKDEQWKLNALRQVHCGKHFNAQPCLLWCWLPLHGHKPRAECTRDVPLSNTIWTIMQISCPFDGHSIQPAPLNVGAVTVLLKASNNIMCPMTSLFCKMVKANKHWSVFFSQSCSGT